MSPSSGIKLYSRSNNTDAALSLRVAQTLHPAGTFIEGGKTSTQVGRVTAVCGQPQRHTTSELTARQLNTAQSHWWHTNSTEREIQALKIQTQTSVVRDELQVIGELRISAQIQTLWGQQWEDADYKVLVIVTDPWAFQYTIYCSAHTHSYYTERRDASNHYFHNELVCWLFLLTDWSMLFFKERQKCQFYPMSLQKGINTQSKCN